MGHNDGGSLSGAQVCYSERTTAANEIIYTFPATTRAQLEGEPGGDGRGRQLHTRMTTRYVRFIVQYMCVYSLNCYCCLVGPSVFEAPEGPSPSKLDMYVAHLPPVCTWRTWS